MVTVAAQEQQALVQVEGLHLDLPSPDGRRAILRDVSFAIAPGESVALVGESGAGKSMTLRCILGLPPFGARVAGDIAWAGGGPASSRGRDVARFRATSVGMIFQDPRASINPLHTVGSYVLESLFAAGVGRREAMKRALDLMRAVGIPDGERRMTQYPQELSGGLLQRIAIVAAMATRPRLLLADEPTTNLDVRTQADVLSLIEGLRVTHHTALLLVTHDLDLAAAVADRVAIMYAGRIVETGRSDQVLAAPQHPYTAALLMARPRLDRRERIATIPGRPAAAHEVSQGCPFAPRCRFAVDRCRTESPVLRSVRAGEVACHRVEELRQELVHD